jgi:hypothetical protein
VSLTGAGGDTSVLFWPNGGGLSFKCTAHESCLNISNLTFAVGCSEGRNGITITRPTPITTVGRGPQSNFTNLIFRGEAPTDFWSRAVSVRDLNVINFTNVLVTGNVTVAYADAGNGFELSGKGVVFNFTNVAFHAVGNGIVLSEYVQGIKISGCNFTGCTNGILGVPGPSGTSVMQVTVSDSQFDCKSCGIASLEGVELGHLNINGNLFLLRNGATGVSLNAEASTTINGNIFTYNPHPHQKRTGVVALKTNGPGGLLIANRFWGLEMGWILGTQTGGW